MLLHDFILFFHVKYILMSEIISIYSSSYNIGPHVCLQFSAIINKAATYVKIQAFHLQEKPRGRIAGILYYVSSF